LHSVKPDDTLSDHYASNWKSFNYVYEVSSCITEREKKIRRHYKIGKLAMFKEMIGVYR